MLESDNPILDPSNEIIGINDYSFDSKNNESFRQSDLYKSTIDSVYKFFTCPSCSKLVEKSIVCIKCKTIYCVSCSKNYQSCPNCKSSPFKGENNADVDYTVSKIFSKGKLLNENLKFSILHTISLKTLLEEKIIKTIINEEKDEDFSGIQEPIRKTMTENLLNNSLSEIYDNALPI